MTEQYYNNFQTLPACPYVLESPPVQWVVCTPGVYPELYITPTPTVPTVAEVSVSPTVSSESEYDASLSLHMEQVWNGAFAQAFGSFGDKWFLLPTLNSVDEPGWGNFQDSAKVRFICSDCGRAWTSMKGRCTFWYKYDPNSRMGVVLFKLYGQRCQHCSTEDKFHHAMWYPREVMKVVENIFQKVGETFYQFPSQQVRVDRRPGKPRHRHNKDLCQACRDGICKDGNEKADK